MFYSAQILSKKGPLGTCWLASWSQRSLKRNEVFNCSLPAAVGEWAVCTGEEWRLSKQRTASAAGQARQADEAGWGPGKRLESRKLAGAQPAGGSRLPWQPRHQHASAMLESQAKPCLVARGQQDGLGAWQEVQAVRAAVCGRGWAGAGVINLGRWRSSLNPPQDSILCLLHRDPPFKKASSSSVACVHAFSSSVLPAPSTPLGSSPGVMGAESWVADMEIAKLH